MIKYYSNDKILSREYYSDTTNKWLQLLLLLTVQCSLVCIMNYIDYIHCMRYRLILMHDITSITALIAWNQRLIWNAPEFKFFTQKRQSFTKFTAFPNSLIYPLSEISRDFEKRTSKTPPAGQVLQKSTKKRKRTYTVRMPYNFIFGQKCDTHWWGCLQNPSFCLKGDGI